MKEKKPFSKLERVTTAEEAIFASAGDHIMGLVVVDKNGKITRINKAFEVLTGWNKEEAIGRRLIKIIPMEDEKNKRIPFKKRILSKILSEKILTTISPSPVLATATTIAANIEKLPIFYYVRRDKTRFPVSTVINPIIFNKEIIGAVEVFYDITKEKELERMRMDFLSLASHQLRTPLSGTKWLIETMYRGIIGEMTKKQKEYLDDIYKINEQMIKLVSDILNTLRLENEETLIKKKKISISSLLKDVLITVSAAAKSKKITLRSSLNHRTFIIETDPEILKSILGCFLSNAINYSMPNQEVILGIKNESKTIVFFVRDFGIGIPKMEHNRIFERFYRASNAKKMIPSGTGLGLNIAKTIAEKIDAEISFESEENKGSTFYLRIPKRSNRGINKKKLKINKPKYE
jgi:signal transduction histidine kinase